MLERFDNDFERTVFGKVKSMSIKEFGDFCFMLYNKGWSDGRGTEDWETFIRCDYPYQPSLTPWNEDE